MTRSPALHAALASALFLAACGGDSNGPPPSSNTTQDYITAVSATVGAAASRTGLARLVNGIRLKPKTVQQFSLVMPPVTAVYHPGTPPASSGGLTAQATPNDPPVGRGSARAGDHAGQYATIHRFPAAGDPGL